MCGIVGIVDLAGERPVDRAVLERMNSAQSHRGPDGDGFHLEAGVGFGHRRLSIIDLTGGHQPLYNEDGSVVVTYNGEIYNFHELMVELAQRGHVFRTRCDTEVIVHAWEEWGESCVQRFNGMFAFAIWDRNKKTVFLARDRLGIKPLYYTITPDAWLVFGSELKAILAAGATARRVNVQAVEEYFAFGYVPDPKTILDDVAKLAPAHTLAVTRSSAAVNAHPKQYWDIDLTPRNGLALPDLAEELIARLRRSVEMQMVSDVPLGAFLSGGVDSSAVVAMMSAVSATPVRTCSIAFADPKFDESKYATLVAEKFKTVHRVDQVDPNELGLIDRLAALYDEPYADSSAMPTYRVCEMARKNVTVALSGDGGDENFGGYRRYRWHAYEEAIRSRIPAALRRPLFGTLGRLYPKLDWAPKVLRAKSTLEAIGHDSLEGYFHSVTIMPSSLRARMFSARLRSQLQGYEALNVFKEHKSRAPGDPLSLVQYLDYKTYLPGDILTKVDRASMAHSLEVRVPILDHELVDWVASVSPKLKLNGGEGKYFFKKALEPHLPSDVLYRPKMGFAVPLAQWFRREIKEMARSRLLSDGFLACGMFDRDFVKRMLDEHAAGTRDYSAPLWALLMFDGFQRKVLGSAA